MASLEKFTKEQMIPRGTSRKIHVFYQLHSSKTGSRRLEQKGKTGFKSLPANS